MKLGRIVATSALAASIGAVGLAGPASATDDITQASVGVYAVQYQTSKNIWVAVPCDDGSDQCLQVSEFASSDTKMKHPRWTANAYWSVGSWIISPIDNPTAIKCKQDNSVHGAAVTYSWDAASNEGYRSYFNPGVCDGKARTVASAFTLTKIATPSAAAPAT